MLMEKQPETLSICVADTFEVVTEKPVIYAHYPVPKFVFMPGFVESIKVALQNMPRGPSVYDIRLAMAAHA